MLFPRLELYAIILQACAELVILQFDFSNLFEEFFALDYLTLQLHLQFFLEHHAPTFEHGCDAFVAVEGAWRLRLLRKAFALLFPGRSDSLLLALHEGHFLIQSGENATDHELAMLQGGLTTHPRHADGAHCLHTDSHSTRLRAHSAEWALFLWSRP